MIKQHTLQTLSAFDRIYDALRGQTDDNLDNIIDELEYLLYIAKDIHDREASITDGSDYEPPNYCKIPHRY